MGGKFFKNIKGYSLCDRIPTADISTLTEIVLRKFSSFFDKIEMVISKNALNTKDSHGDLDFVCLKNKNSVSSMRKYCDNNNIQYGNNGNMEHVKFPFGNKFYQIDFILSNDKLEFETELFFYKQDLCFNAAVGHFARSIGYKFSTKGLLLHITDKRKQNYYVELTRDLDKILELLCLKMPEKLEDLYVSPQVFVDWITSSPRYDAELMSLADNKNSHRDAKRDVFCGEVYSLLERDVSELSIPPSKIDFTQENFDLKPALEFERKFLGNQIADRVIAFCEEKAKVAKPIIRGDVLLDFGYKQGPIIGKIIQDVSKKFTKDTPEEEIKKYVLDKYSPLEEEVNV